MPRPDQRQRAHSGLTKVRQTHHNGPSGPLSFLVEQPSPAVEIRVTDTGVGIPPEDLPFIFEEFRQVERQGSTEKEGTGLGLAIARKSVELLGGTLTAESHVGEGASFILKVSGYAE